MADTIAALASGAGRSGIAVVRASGPAVRLILRRIAGDIPDPRHATLRRLRTVTGETIDDAVVLFFPAPASFTGEDVVELHVHGGRAVIAALLQALTAIESVRIAGPGEFTRRAVENGRLDLTRAEGIADLIEAETAAQRRQALQQASGALENAAESWRKALIDILALAEAEIDFPDEDDVPALFEDIHRRTGELRSEIGRALAGADRGERVRRGAMFVLAGPTNAGKSTLLNALAQRDVAIVSTHAGTTRDAIEVQADLDGLPVTFVDTAGLRETVDPVEAVGIERTLARARQADLVIWLTSPDADGQPPDVGTNILYVRTKGDLLESPPERGAMLTISAQTGAGMDELTGILAEAARTALQGGEDALVTRARHRSELEAVARHLEAAASLSSADPIEFLAEELRLATRSLGRLTGRVDVDEIYDVIFSSFCIGK
jgi:tRNA modification GTPase